MSGERSLFLPAFTSWVPIFADLKPLSSIQNNHSGTGFLVDERLTAVFHDMQYAVKLLNEGVKQKTRHTGEAFQPILTSAQTRLVRLEIQITDIFSECMRLALLAFYSHAMNFPSLQFRSTNLETRLACTWKLLRQESAYPKKERIAFEFWIAVVAVGSLSGFGRNNLTDGFIATVRKHIPTWKEANKQLLDVMSISSIHDVLGEATFRRLFQQD